MFEGMCEIQLFGAPVHVETLAPLVAMDFFVVGPLRPRFSPNFTAVNTRGLYDRALVLLYIHTAIDGDGRVRTLFLLAARLVLRK